MIKRKIDLKLKFLKDNPISKDEKNYYDFYHNFVSPALDRALKAKNCVNIIGLFGKWGSGKSTIIKNLEKEYSDEYKIFIFDTWKYQEDPLRRSFLINFFEYVKKNKLVKIVEDKDLDEIGENELPENYLDDLYETKLVSEKFKITLSSNKFPKWFKKLIKIIRNNSFLIILASLVLSFILVILGFKGNKIINSISSWLGGIIVAIVTFSTGMVFLEKAFEWMVNKFFESLNKEGSFHTLTKQKKSLNSPEQFEEKFKGIIDKLNKRVVIVFDNIDRVHGDTVIKTLSTIKTFFNSEKDDVENKKKITFLVPCDSEAIIGQLENLYTKVKGFDSSEYLRKIFNITVWTPDFITSDLGEFTRKKIELSNISKLIPDTNKIDELINLINSVYKDNPREIIQFINNLSISLLIASNANSDVWNTIRQNISYLAKVLILKQKFPEGYISLREKFYKPESIFDEKSPEDFKYFMRTNSHITVETAKPFIYFKQANISNLIKNSNKLESSLLADETESTISIINDNQKKLDKVALFVVDLYSSYSNEADRLVSIINTFLNALNNLSLNINGSEYLNKTAEIIESSIWHKYRELDIDLIFNLILNKSGISSSLKVKIINRYILVLDSKEIINSQKGEGIKIIKNLSITKINTKQQESLKGYIEKNFSQSPEVFSIFGGLSIQKRHITTQAFVKFVQSLGSENYESNLPILTKYKMFIKKNNLWDTVTNTLISLLTSERGIIGQESSRYSVLFENINNLFRNSTKIFSEISPEIIISLNNELVSFYQAIPEPELKVKLIPILYNIAPFLDESNEKQLNQHISNFIKSTSMDIWDDLLEELGIEKIKDFSNKFIDTFKEIAVNKGGPEIKKFFSLMSRKGKEEVLNEMISRRPDLGFSFIQSIENELPDKIVVLGYLLNKVGTLKLEDRNQYYEWITARINKTDELSIKGLIVSHIKTLITSDQPVSQQIGLSLLHKSVFLSETHKREIGDSLIDWLKTTGKVINENHKYLLNAISFLFISLYQTRKNEFIHILFELLDRQSERLVLEMSISILSEIKPSWKEYNQYYIDIKEKLKSWSNKENRNYLIIEVGQLKSKKSTREERLYLKELESLEIKDE